MIKHFVKTGNRKKIDVTEFEEYQYGRSIIQYNGEEINLNSIDIAIMGWGNNYYSSIQQSLYSLAKNFKSGNLIDLGEVNPDIVPLIELIDLLLLHDVFPIIITPTGSATVGQIKAYEQRYELLNLALIDSKIEFSPYKADATINQVLEYHPHLIFHLSCIGHQSQLTDKNTVDFLEDKYFEAHRLGAIQGNMDETEPMVRDLDLAGFSISSIRSADAPANIFRNPNGFTATEACKIIRYITMSDRLSSLCIYGYDLSIDDRGQTSNMIAQLIWFAIEGYYARIQEFPIIKKELKAYVVDNKIMGSISFYKSVKSDRWWFEIPKALHRKNKLIACSYKDYKIACEGELPERLLNAIKRLA